MELTEELLTLLRCPLSGQPLAIASNELVDSLNEQRRGSSPIQGGLLREDGKLLYPIIDDFPVLLGDEAIAMPPANN